MSTLTQTRVQARRIPAPAFDHGAAARQLEPDYELEAAPERRRTPLSVVPAVVRHRKTHFAVFCFGVMLAALASVLVLNIQVTSGQYEVVGLRNAERALTQENEALTQQAQHLEAPQNVAAKAAKLGMVVPGSVASIDLGTLKVSGVSTPAQEEKAPTSLVARPQAPQSGPAATAAEPAAVEAPAAPAGPAADTEAAAATPEAAAPVAAPTVPVEAGAERPEFPANELNGGTIPAPAQQGAGR
ncbi:MAG: hypothetical protein ABWX68_09390 [Arthrobacter sp.]|uniref:hypothetical protein n=1 Tax=Arthrobacter sp. TaxID=1667 RepID=UPI0034790A7B